MSWPQILPLGHHVSDVLAYCQKKKRKKGWMLATLFDRSGSLMSLVGITCISETTIYGLWLKI